MKKIFSFLLVWTFWSMVIDAQSCSEYPYVSFMGNTLLNHSYVDLGLVGDARNSIQCHTDLSTCCSNNEGDNRGNWIPPDTSISLPFSGAIFQKRRLQRVDLRHSSDSSVTSGIYHCAIETNAVHRHYTTNDAVWEIVYIGIYLNGGDVTIINGVTLTVDSDLNGASPQFTLTCISTGGPATTVTWTKDSVTISEGTNTVLDDPATSQYTHTLTVSHRLNTGKTYSCEVANEKPSSASESISIKVATVVTNIVAVQEDVTTINVSWSPPTPSRDVTGYRIDYSNGISSSSVNVSGASTSNYQLTGLQNGVSYTIVIVSISQHFYKESTSININLVPGQPSLGVTSSTATSISTFWILNDGSLVTEYELSWQRDTSVGCSNDEEGNIMFTDESTSYDIMGLEEDSSYIIKVIALNSAGRSQVSELNTVVEMTTEAVPSAAPSAISVLSTSNHSVTIQWRTIPCIKQNGDITEYKIKYEGGGTTQYIIDVAGSSTNQLTISGLQMSTNYSIQVAGVNIVGVGEYSFPPLFAVTDGILSVSLFDLSSTYLTLSLSLVPGNVATGYTINFFNVQNTWCFIDSYNITDIGGNETMFTLTDLQEYTTYSITVTVLLSDGGTADDSLNITTMVAVPSAAPSSVNVSIVYSTTITVYWGPVDCIHNNGDITGYSVQYGEVGSVSLDTMFVSGGSIMKTNISNLMPSTTYTVKVAAVNSAGNGIYSTSVEVETLATVYMSLNDDIIPNHGYLMRSDIGSTEDTALICNTNRPATLGTNSHPHSGGDWFTPNSLTVNYNVNAPGFRRNRGPMIVRLITQSTGTEPDGIYHCVVEDDTFTQQSVYVGLYSGNTSLDVSVMIRDHIDDIDGGSVQFKLICISIGEPATTVTWTREGVTITEGNQSQLDDPVTSTYTHTLSVTGRLGGLYTCTVANNKPSMANTTYKVKVASSPTDLRTIQQNTTTILVSWNPPTPLGDTTGYKVVYGDGSNSVVVSDGYTDNISLTGLVSGASYTISLIAKSQHLSSASITTQVTLIPLPEQPVVNAISVTATSISLSWSVANVSFETNSEVTWQVTSNGDDFVPDKSETSGIITETSYTILFNTSGNFSIRVTLINDAGKSMKSEPLTFSVTKEYNNYNTTCTSMSGSESNTTIIGLIVGVVFMFSTGLIIIVVLILKKCKGKSPLTSITWKRRAAKIHTPSNEAYRAVERETKIEESNEEPTYINVNTSSRYSTYTPGEGQSACVYEEV